MKLHSPEYRVISEMQRLGRRGVKSASSHYVAGNVGLAEREVDRILTAFEAQGCVSKTALEGWAYEKWPEADRQVRQGPKNPYQRRPKRDEHPDYCDKPGAEYLARKISDYWLKRGYAVAVHVRSNSISCEPALVWSIRSDMQNGWPAQITVKAVAA